MQFHEYRLTKSVNPTADISKMNVRDYYSSVMNRIRKTGIQQNIDGLAIQEYLWILNRRAFYNVYPAVVKCLMNTTLDVKPSQIGQLDSVAICFARGHEIKLSDSVATSILFQLQPELLGDSKTQIVATLSADRVEPDGTQCYTCTQTDNRNFSLLEEKLGDRSTLLKIAVGVAMLAQDERFVEPILLNRDRNRKFRTAEEYNAAVERAVRRGRYGMEIGRELEVSPHVRRPHFGIRWTCKGRTTPRLVPIRGCIVKRSRVYPIPTGYMDKIPLDKRNTVD